MTATLVRRRVVVSGVVQGVGFRPFVHRLAERLNLAGRVGNDSTSVTIEVEGLEPAVAELVRCLRAEAPPLARIERIHESHLEPRHDDGFVIVESEVVAGARTLVPPDVAVCDECVAELFDPADRRYRYPFVTCTNCGPRFTIIRDLPYDRPNTTMAGFELCPECAAEYDDPSDRRFHAQPLACEACGPRVRLDERVAAHEGTDVVVARAQQLLGAGAVVAVKGLGGYHLAADPRSDVTLARLRGRKGRADKPFAVMVRNLETAERLAVLDDAERAALTDPARPVVLVRRRPTAGLSELVAPGNPLLGVMLPYTPLHHLLFAPVPEHHTVVPDVLVMTSANVSDEPICFEDGDAEHRLALLADAVLGHDRPIHVPCDDSVVRVVDGEVQPIRRSRGHAPLPVSLPVEIAPTVAVGGELKNAGCVARGRHAWMTQHVGDLGNLETLAALDATIDQFSRMYEVEPEVVACDAHPGYLSRRVAATLGEGDPVEVQHHHAHVAAVMAEHGLDGSVPVIGLAFDGTGYGDDGAIWGGEVLVADYSSARRVGHLAELPLPGGDAAVRNPCRLAIAYLAACGVDPVGLPPWDACDDVERNLIVRQVERAVAVVPTTSMGRLFDAVASLLGLRHRITYEAQAAIELEIAAADATVAAPVRSPLHRGGVLDPAPALHSVADGVRAGVDPGALARGFHVALAHGVVELVGDIREATGLDVVALSGGVFQNVLLTRLLRSRLEAEGLRVLTHRLVPPNDGGLALGQAVVAAHARS